MFDQILQMATSQLKDQFVAHDEVPTEQAGQIAEVTGESIFGAVSDQLSSGNLGFLQEMLSGQQTSGTNPLVSGIANSVVTNLVGKLGLNPSMAQTIASVAVPFVLNMFNDKVNNAQQNQGLDVGSLLGSVLGGGNQQQQSSGGLGGLLGGLLGGGNKQQAQQPSGQDLLGSVLGQLLK